MKKLILSFVLIAVVSMGFSQNLDTTGINKLLDKTLKKKQVFGLQLTVQKGSEIYNCSKGNLANDRQFFIASTTKLYVTAIILKLKEEGKLSLNDSISKFLSKETMEGLHVYKRVDYSQSITIKNLLAHTSGLPDYFEDKNKGEKSLLENLFKGQDQTWTFKQTVDITKKLEPKFEPCKKGKAHYSDSNFQLLGKIIENITGLTFNQALDQFIISPLELKQTYMYSDSLDTIPALIYLEKDQLNIPKAMSSFGPDGGIVSTSKELNIFLTAFYQGKLFPKAYIEDLKVYNRIMFPLQNGIGMMRFKLPGAPEFMGHSGLSGAFAYYVPKKDLFISGTVNQLSKPGTSYQLMGKLLRFVK